MIKNRKDHKVEYYSINELTNSVQKKLHKFLKNKNKYNVFITRFKMILYKNCGPQFFMYIV